MSYIIAMSVYVSRLSVCRYLSCLSVCVSLVCLFVCVSLCVCLSVCVSLTCFIFEQLELRYQLLRKPLGMGRETVKFPCEASPETLHFVAVDAEGTVTGMNPCFSN